MSSKKDAIINLLGSNPLNKEIKETLNIDLGESLNEEKKKVKASFDFDQDFHTELKVFAATQGKKMVDVVVEAVKLYMDQNK